MLFLAKYDNTYNGMILCLLVKKKTNVEILHPKISLKYHTKNEFENIKSK